MEQELSLDARPGRGGGERCLALAPCSSVEWPPLRCGQKSRRLLLSVGHRSTGEPAVPWPHQAVGRLMPTELLGGEVHQCDRKLVGPGMFPTGRALVLGATEAHAATEVAQAGFHTIASRGMRDRTLAGMPLGREDGRSLSPRCTWLPREVGQAADEEALVLVRACGVDKLLALAISWRAIAHAMDLNSIRVATIETPATRKASR
ncbi:hypothetical protein PC128_g13463 [Phytophthora cactorum]|nr:hypothetical protein PC128_g13463 [Phytophthora cactorum]